jgi:hypothetical protein
MTSFPNSPLSLWLAEYGAYREEPALEGEITVDVAIVGGGFTGYGHRAHPLEGAAGPARRRVGTRGGGLWRERPQWLLLHDGGGPGPSGHGHAEGQAVRARGARLHGARGGRTGVTDPRQPASMRLHPPGLSAHGHHAGLCEAHPARIDLAHQLGIRASSGWTRMRRAPR